jgi:hypothetical protein
MKPCTLRPSRSKQQSGLSVDESDFASVAPVARGQSVSRRHAICGVDGLKSQPTRGVARMNGIRWPRLTLLDKTDYEMQLPLYLIAAASYPRSSCQVSKKSPANLCRGDQICEFTFSALCSRKYFVDNQVMSRFDTSIVLCYKLFYSQKD